MAQLKYPLEKQDVYKGRVVFREQLVQTAFDRAVAGARENGEIPLDQLVGGDRFTDTGSAVELYLPPSIQISDGVNYENFQLGILPELVGAAAGAGAGLGQVVSAISENVQTNINDVITAFKSGQYDDAARASIAKAAGRFTSRDVQGYVSGQTRVVANPNTRTLFSGVNIREFTFSFEFKPTSAAEAESTVAIIRYFRERIYPEAISVQGVERVAYKFPNPFKIEMFYGGKKLSGSTTPALLQCYLRSMATNYNPSSMAMYSDGKFSEYSLSLNFVEHRTLEKQDVRGGF